MEFPVPNLARELSSQLLAGQIDVKNLKLSLLPEQLIKRFDTLHAQATRNLVEFSAGFETDNEQVPAVGYTMIRKYERPGTGFQYQTDPVAPGSIVVEKSFRKRIDSSSGKEVEVEPEKTIYWVSGEKDSKGRPYIYLLLAEDSEKIQSSSENDQKKLVARLNWDEPLGQEQLQYLFCTDWPPSESGKVFGRNEVEIWRKGKGMSRRVEERHQQKVGKLIPIPQPVTS